MNHFALDASALAKRYVMEPGTAAMNSLFTEVRPLRRHCLSIAPVEAVSVISRARNGGRLTARSAGDAIDLLNDEVLGGGVRIIPMDNDLVFGAIPLVSRHNVNSTDAVLLLAALELRAALLAEDDDLVLVASDRRLLRAAGDEGLPVFDPETEDLAALRGLAETA